MMSNFNSYLDDEEPMHSTNSFSNSATISLTASSTTTALSSTTFATVVSTSYGTTRRYGTLERTPHPSSPGNQQTSNGASAFMSALSMIEFHRPPLTPARLADNAPSAALMGPPTHMHHRGFSLGRFNYPNRSDPIVARQSNAENFRRAIYTSSCSHLTGTSIDKSPSHLHGSSDDVSKNAVNRALRSGLNSVPSKLSTCKHPKRTVFDDNSYQKTPFAAAEATLSDAFLVRKDNRQTNYQREFNNTYSTSPLTQTQKTQTLPLSDPVEYPFLTYGSSQPATSQKIQLPNSSSYVSALKEPANKPSDIDRFRIHFPELPPVEGKTVEMQTKEVDKYGVETDLWYTDNASPCYLLQKATDMDKNIDNDRIAFERSLRDVWKNNDIFAKDNAHAKGITKNEVTTKNAQLNRENGDEGDVSDWITSDRWSTLQDGLDIPKRSEDFKVTADDEGEASDWITSDRWSTLQDGLDIPKRSEDFKVTADGVMKNVPSSMIHNEFGLLGLMSYLGAKQYEHNMDNMIKDVDLSEMGLNKASNGYVFNTFRGPWVDKSYSASNVYQGFEEYELTGIVKSKLPQCNYKEYREEVLFYIFYFEMPNGDMQLDAACELYDRGWRFHKDLKGWISQKQFMPFIKLTKKHEHGTYLFFDPTLWKMVEKSIDLEYIKLEANPALNKTF